MKKQAFIIIGVLLVIAAFLRLYQIGPFMTFLGDQGRDAIIIKRIVTFEHFPAIGAPSSVGQIYLGPFYYYLVAPFLFLFNFNPVGLGVGVAILTLIAMIYVAYEMQKEFGIFFTTIFIALLTFSFSLIDLSRFSWNPNLLPYFSFISLFFFYKWITKKREIYAILTGSFLACSFQLHYLALLIFIPIGIFYVYVFIAEKKKWLFIKQSVLATGAFIFFSIPLILFDIKNNFLNVKSFYRLLTNENMSSDSSYIVKLQEAIRGFIVLTLRLEATTIIAISIMVLFIIGSLVIAKKLKNIFITLNIVTIIIYLFGFALLSTPSYIHYFGSIYVCFYFLLSFFVLLIPQRKIQYAMSIILVGIFIYSQVSYYYFFTQEPNNQIQHAKHIANTFGTHIQKQPIQIVALPFTETDGHYRYFLELNGYHILPLESPEQAEELFVMCFDKTNCHPLDDPHWQIAAFYDKMLAESWQSENITIYKIVHKSHE
ncbi:MAG TPA: hypothetical protein PLS49_00310 [Candidatus Woesebacteria bacterium]|nr:hypothetical protein [Candidatus Woesebacteria bacterium]